MGETCHASKITFYILPPSRKKTKTNNKTQRSEMRTLKKKGRRYGILKYYHNLGKQMKKKYNKQDTCFYNKLWRKLTKNTIWQQKRNTITLWPCQLDWPLVFIKDKCDAIPKSIL